MGFEYCFQKGEDRLLYHLNLRKIFYGAFKIV